MRVRKQRCFSFRHSRRRQPRKLLRGASYTSADTCRIGTSRIWSNSHFRREAFAVFSWRLMLRLARVLIFRPSPAVALCRVTSCGASFRPHASGTFVRIKGFVLRATLPSELRLSSIRQRLLAFAPIVIVSCHGAQLAFVGIFCGFARTRLERNEDLRNQQVAVRDTMLGAEPRNLLSCPHVVSDQDRKNSLRQRLPLSL
jgi:hypothetical protein